MSLFETLKILHILGAVVWFGGDVMINLFAHRAIRSDDTAIQAYFARSAGAGARLIAGSGFAVTIAGIWMVADVPAFSFGETWVVIGLIAAAAGAGLGAGFFGPQVKKIIVSLEAGDGPGAVARMKRIVMVSHVELVILLVTVWAMVAKPGA